MRMDLEQQPHIFQAQVKLEIIKMEATETYLVWCNNTNSIADNKLYSNIDEAESIVKANIDKLVDKWFEEYGFIKHSKKSLTEEEHRKNVREIYRNAYTVKTIQEAIGDLNRIIDDSYLE